MFKQETKTCFNLEEVAPGKENDRHKTAERTKKMPRRGKEYESAGKRK